MCTSGQEHSQYPDGHPAVQNTGGKPTPEAVERAPSEGPPMTGADRAELEMYRREFGEASRERIYQHLRRRNCALAKRLRGMRKRFKQFAACLGGVVATMAADGNGGSDDDQ